MTLPGLGKTSDTSHLVQKIIEDGKGSEWNTYNLLTIEHPDHLSENFTLDRCIQTARGSILYALANFSPKQIITVGSSLGAYAFYHALKELLGSGEINGTTFHALFVSCIPAYAHIVENMGGTEETLAKITDGDGYCNIQVNPGDPAVKFHPNFVRSIGDDRDICFAPRPVDIFCFQGGKDKWADLQNVGGLNAGEVRVVSDPLGTHALPVPYVHDRVLGGIGRIIRAR